MDTHYHIYLMNRILNLEIINILCRAELRYAKISARLTYFYKLCTLGSILSIYITCRNCTVFFSLPQDNYTHHKALQKWGLNGMFWYLNIYFLLLSVKRKLYLNIQSENINLNIKISNNSYYLTEQKYLTSKIFFSSY